MNMCIYVADDVADEQGGSVSSTVLSAATKKEILRSELYSYYTYDYYSCGIYLYRSWHAYIAIGRNSQKSTRFWIYYRKELSADF